MPTIPTLHKDYAYFLEEQLPIIRQVLPQYDTETGGDFLKFILKILPNATTSARGHLVDNKEMPRTMQKLIENLWNGQAYWWGYAESLPNYYICMSLISTWLKQLDSSPKDVLSIGCGPGLYELFLEHHFNDRFREIICSDISANMIAQVKQNQRVYKSKYSKKSNLKLKVCSLEALPFEDQSTDVIICNKVLHWSEKKMDALDQMVRVLRPGGLGMLIFAKGPVAVTLKGGDHHVINHGGDYFKVIEYLQYRKLCGIADSFDISFPKPFGQDRGGINDLAILFRKI